MQKFSLNRFSFWLNELMSIHPDTSTFCVVKRLALIYLLAHGGIFLLLNAVYWDDWILFKANDVVISTMFHEANPFLDITSPIHIALLKFGPWSYHLLGFFLMFFSGLFLWGILAPIKFLTHQEKFGIVTLFMVLPLNAARVALMNVPSTVTYFGFFLGWWLLIKIERPYFRLIAVGLFLLSFRNNGLLIFYALPIAYLYYLENGITLDRSLSWALRRLDLLLLPVFYWFLKITYFKPTGLYVGYNEIHMANLEYWLLRMLPLAIVGVALVLLRSKLFGYTSRVQEHAFRIEKYEFISIVLAFSILFSVRMPSLIWLLFLGLGFYQKRNGGRILTKEIWLICLGLIVMYLGMLPFFAVEKTPRFYDWDSRFQQLMPLGASIVAVGIIKILGENIKLALLLLLVAIVAFMCPDLLAGKLPNVQDWQSQLLLTMPLLASIAIVSIIYLSWRNLKLIALLAIGAVLVNLFIYIEYAIDWQKQQYVISRIAASEEARRASTIIVDDHTTLLDARTRSYRFYEYTGWFKTAFGDESRLGFNLSQLQPDGRMPELLPKPFDIASQRYMTSAYKEGAGSILLMTIRYGKAANLLREPLDVSFKPFSI